MGDIVGKYKGIKVYRVTLPEYVNGRLYKDEENMYLIGEDLIYKNETFAKYNGTYVEEYDLHERATYYTVPKFGAGTDPIPAINRGLRTPEEPSTSSIGTADGDTNSETEMETPEVGTVSDFQPEDVTDVLTSVYDTDYFSEMTDIDAFLKSNS